MVPGLVLVALALRLYGLKAGLPEVYEEAYPFKKAWAMWGFGPGRGLDLNPHWFRYPGLTIELQFLGQGAIGKGACPDLLGSPGRSAPRSTSASCSSSTRPPST